MTGSALHLNPARTAVAAARQENFPVASRLMGPAVRPHVMRFYAFARAADDIADDPALAPEEKLERLARFREALTGSLPPAEVPEAAALRATLDETGVSSDHALALLDAFEHDATCPRTRSWAALLDYCRLSANPVGRMVLELHGEGARTHGPSDALCTALQILNHLQDCGEDYRRLGRIYLPADWLAEEGVPEGALAAPAGSPALGRVLERTLVATNELLRAAAPLPAAIGNRRLALEAAVILRLARALASRLKGADPIADRVRVGRSAMAALGLSAAIQEGWARVRR